MYVTDKYLYVPLQGSPKTLLLACSKQDLLCWHFLLTVLLDLFDVSKKDVIVEKIKIKDLYAKVLLISASRV